MMRKQTLLVLICLCLVIVETTRSRSRSRIRTGTGTRNYGGGGCCGPSAWWHVWLLTIVSVTIITAFGLACVMLFCRNKMTGEATWRQVGRETLWMFLISSGLWLPYCCILMLTKCWSKQSCLAGNAWAASQNGCQENLTSVKFLIFICCFSLSLFLRITKERFFENILGA